LNTIADLLKLNVNEHTERKNGLTYLSWAWAWAEALKADPAATFTVQMFGDSPLCRIGKTALVFVTVTMFGKPMTCQLPVMDHRNKAIPDPDAFSVNTAIMRCMTKALALHGIGLYIYAGEDLPPDSDAPEQITQGAPKKSAPNGSGASVKEDAFAAQQPEVQDSLRKVAQHVVAAMPDAAKAKDILVMGLEEWPDEDRNELKVALWHLLDSKTRAAIKSVEHA
jgi:hypothetical protein